MSYFKNTVRGLTWIGGGRVFTRMISFLRLLILARLLSPSQFGLFTLSALVLSLFDVTTETGTDIFLIQENKSLKTYLNEVWLISIVKGFIIWFFVFSIASLAEGFFHSPGLGQMLRFISFVPLLQGFTNPAEVLFQKRLDFKRDFYLRSSVFFVDSLIVVIVALLTHSAMSFIFGLLVGSAFELMISFLFIRPHPLFSFKPSKVRTILHRGKWVTTFSLLNFIALELDNAVVGKLLNTGSLGIYQVGYKLATLPVSEISDVINRVAFPFYSKITMNKSEIKKSFFKNTSLVTLSTLLFGIIIFFLPNQFFVIILGEKWVGVTAVVRILIVYGILRSIYGSTASLFLSLRKQNIVATITFVRFLVLAITIVPFTARYGIVGASYSALFSVFAETPFVLYYLWRILA